MQARRASGPRWSRGVPIAERGPGASFRPDDVAPSLHALHQPAITTPVLDHVAFAALDVVSAAELGELLAGLTDAGERLMREAHRRPGEDGPAGSLTVTIGLGPGLFAERFGLAGRRPLALARLPAFVGDALDPAMCGGDLCVQVCATQPRAAEDALARLVAVAGTVARVRWSQRGWMYRAPADRPGAAPRNLLGFKDGTSNPRRGRDLDRHVWVSGRERTWMVGGTFLVVRRVRMLDAWNALSPDEQERVIGRHRVSGAPLGGTHEFEKTPVGAEVPIDAHARVAAPRANDGVTLLRRGYSFDDGVDAAGERDAGLLLLLYQRDPRRQFIPLQRRVSERDALSRFTRAVGSAIFAIPPGARDGRCIADGLVV